MATILTFDRSRCRLPMQLRSDSGAPAASAEILFFTGIRREPLKLSYAPRPDREEAPVRRDPGRQIRRHPEPMFDDDTPQKPARTKRRTSKSR